MVSAHTVKTRSGLLGVLMVSLALGSVVSAQRRQLQQQPLGGPRLRAPSGILNPLNRPPRQPQGPPSTPGSSNPVRPAGPVLLEGSDLLDFQVPEDTPVGAQVYQLKGGFPDGVPSKVLFTISGDVFTVDQETGVISLKEPLDRETKEFIDVVVTVQDEDFTNIVPFRRRIRVSDVNDNKPTFIDGPFKFMVEETLPVDGAPLGSVQVKDLDSGPNGVVRVSCDAEASPEACEVFRVDTKEVSPGTYSASIHLIKPLDYEARSSYDITLVAADNAPGAATLRSSTIVQVEVTDVQDQPPVFLNAPYTATVPENTSPGTELFKILVRDGDTGRPRRIDLSIAGDHQGLFSIGQQQYDEVTGVVSVTLIKSDGTVLDREDPVIQEGGGLYTFRVQAREILGPDDRDDVANISVSAEVNVVVTDEDDQVPTFNRAEFTASVPEDVTADTPVPDLDIVVSDGDSPGNAAYDLVLEDVENSEGVFTIHPVKATGRNPVIIRVADPKRLDHETPGGRSFVFKVNAVQGDRVVSSATVRILVTDANDNQPLFQQDGYNFTVNESAQTGAFVGTIKATDADSGSFGRVEHSLRGFGAEKFRVDPDAGDIFVNGCGPQIQGACLDYETQKAYSLIFVATDGGGQVTTTSVVINVADVNDNFPVFERKSYVRVVPEGATQFDPPLIVTATDSDGPTQGNGKVLYSIRSVNTDETLFQMDPMTGELTIVQPVLSSMVEDGQFSIVVRATDGGRPVLHSEVQVTVEVGSSRNKKPVFEKSEYSVEVPEDAAPKEVIVQVKAEDPEGGHLTYSIHSGAKDNFVIDPDTGEISVSPDAVLDIQENGDTYQIKVRAEDNGKPFSSSAEVTVGVAIRDINDKPPKFDQESYVFYVLESTEVGQVVASVSANDPDRSAELAFAVVDPIFARDKTGNILNNRAAYDFTKAFSIDQETGDLRVNEPLSYSSAAVIVLTVAVEDLNAANDSMKSNNLQLDRAEVTIYVQAFRADSPQFDAPWTPADPRLKFKVKEESQVGSVILKLGAKDPLTGQPVTDFEKVQASDPNNLFMVSSTSGEVSNNQVLDFEQQTELTFKVIAKAAADVGSVNGVRTSEVVVTVLLEDVNDNYPEFEQLEYEAEILESALPNTEVVTVKAMDRDTGSFGQVRYSINGEGSEAFSIDPEGGTIKVRAGVSGRSNVDREVRDQYVLKVVATDNAPYGPNNNDSRSPKSGVPGLFQKSTSVEVHIRVLDENDSAPIFSRSSFTSVVPENSQPGKVVIEVTATDPDLGPGGQVSYELLLVPGPDGSPKTNDLFSIDKATGVIVTKANLTGKGRAAPYILVVRALDGGSPQLFKDTEVYVTVGDVSKNDGVPTFIRPTGGEVAYIPENSKAGTKVYQLEAFDPDNPQIANGKLVYSLPEDGTVIRKLFQVDPDTGVLSTKVKLDREERQNYTLIVDVSDLGSPPQQTSTLLTVVVTDVDDHAPVFDRQKNSVPIELEVMEEIDPGTTIGFVEAVDHDVGKNALVDYAIVDGNDHKIFTVETGANNNGVIKVMGRLDREQSGHHLLTIKCFRPYERNVKSHYKKYDRSLLDEIQVKVVVKDIDDNDPHFLPEHQLGSLGVRVNAPVFTEVTVIKAVDPDWDAQPITYKLLNVTFFRPRTQLKEILEPDVFVVDEDTGLVQTNQTYGRFGDGYFTLAVAASNNWPKWTAVTKVKVHVLQDTDLMKLVFDQDPSTVQKQLRALSDDMGQIFSPQPLKFNFYDTEFYSQVDGSLDFGRTSSCFQVVSDQEVVDTESTRRLLEAAEGAEDRHQLPGLQEVLDKYQIVNIERCAEISTTKKTGWVEIFLLVIAILVGFLALLAAFVMCCLYQRYRNLLHKHAPVKIIEAPVRALIPASLPPGSIHHLPSIGRAPSMSGSDGRVLYDWQEAVMHMDTASYRSLPDA